MKARIALLHWIPRLLVIFFALFLSLFAFDAFEGEATFIQKLVAFAIHLLPALVVSIVTLIAWKHERTGGLLFIGLSILFLSISRLEVATLLLIPGPLILIGILFILDSYLEKSTS